MALFALTLHCVSAQSNSPLINFPSLSPDGQSIAFNFQGDIWISDINGQNTRRITVHEANDTRPLWSKDGSTIAFHSNRYGNNDIYTIPAQGGLPKRLTYHSAGDLISDFTSDGDILFMSRRNFVQVEREPEIQIVNQSGGTPYRYLSAIGFDATLSPNGKFIAFVKGSCRIQREAYRGPANRNIWLYDIKNETYTQLPTYDGNEFFPQWGDDNTIYFQSSRSGKYNVHKLSIDGSGNKSGEVSAITSYKNLGLFTFHLSKNKRDLVTVRGDEVNIVNTSSRASKKVNINIASDYKFDPVEHQRLTNRAGEFAISPDGKHTAFVIRGEIFVKENNRENRRAVNVSNSTSRDRGVAWINDSTLLFVSDRDGQNDFYTVQSDDPNEPNILKSLKHKIKRLTKTDVGESNPVISPDGKKVAFLRGRGKFIVASIAADKLSDETVLLDGWSTPSGYSWSPDSEWLAYNLSDLNFNGEIYIHKADNSQKPVNVSLHPKQDNGPIWSTDGKKLVFSSNRNNGDYDVWFIWLNKADWQKTAQDWEEEKLAAKGGKKKGDDAEKDDKITIDFEDIHERQVQVTRYTGGEFAQAISKNGKTIYYTTGNGTRENPNVQTDLFKIDWNGRNRKAITSNNARPFNLQFNKKQSHLYHVRGFGNLARINVASDKSENLPFVARMDIDYKAESNQIFEEAWKAINDGFYDPDFHGQNWNALKKTYKPLAMKASTRADFQVMFNWMLGQINASHMGLGGGAPREDLQREVTGQMGLEMKPQKDGSLLVEGVIANMPGDREISKINPGDVITAINGTPLTKNLNAYSLLMGTSTEKIYLIVSNSKNKSGRLGYLHIQGMNWISFERFERELTASGLGKEGIVIDVRYNGGGWTTDYLMAVLNVKQYAYTVPRGAAKNLEKEHTKFVNHYPYSERLPLASWVKPSITLINHTSYSNAEIFSHAYKSLGLGKLVGEATFGAVISTGGAGMIDGSFVRMPFRGWYVKNTLSNMELGPATPDIEVYNQPDDRIKKRDTQLKRAVDELLKELGN